MQLTKNISEPETIPKNTAGLYKFWYLKIVNKQGEIEWKIDHLEYIEFLRLLGFRRYDMNDTSIFVKIHKRIIEIVPLTRIKDEVRKYIENVDETFLMEDGITRKELANKFYTSPAIYFSIQKFELLGLQPDLVLNSDTKENGYIYYVNGFVKCYAGRFEFLPYKKLDGYIFQDQIKPREFEIFSSDGMFRKFVFNISGKNELRFNALQTMIGYLLHSYYETKMKAVNLTDSNISDNAEGRTGKTLLGIGISHMKNVCTISGKSFKTDNKHRYESVKLDTQIVFLNDLTKGFEFEHLFNDISDAITVDRKNTQPFTIRAKMLIAANDTFRIEGASAKDRVIEFELADHYKVNFSPEDEFGVWFFKDWDRLEWLRFDNFMIECLTLYLEHGLIQADPINLDKRKQIQHTNRDVVEFLDTKIKDKELRCGIDYNKNDLHAEFLENYPEYKDDKWLKRNSNFIKYIKTYAAYSPELRGEIEERKSNGQCFIKFKKTANEQTNLPF